MQLTSVEVEGFSFDCITDNAKRFSFAIDALASENLAYDFVICKLQAYSYQAKLTEMHGRCKSVS